MFKKTRYQLENFLYKIKYGKNINIENFKIKENLFSKRKLNIMILTYADHSFVKNNSIIPLKDFGELFVFVMTDKTHEKDWYLNKQKINDKMLSFVYKIVKENKIDVIICHLSGHSTTPLILEKIKKLNIPMINESLDDETKFRSRKGKDGFYRGMKDICKFFDISLTTSKNAVIKYLVEGGSPIYKDYCGNEKIYKNIDIKKEYDVGFIGQSYGVRKEYVDYLINNGVNVYAKGSGWKGGFSTDDEMIDIFNKSKIVLGFSTVGKNDDVYILKGRDFEVPLTGSFYITGYHKELEEYFNIGRDIETYNSKKDLLKKVKYYLENEKEREIIARNGYEKCIKNYTAKRSYEKLFGYLGL
ncbi:MAG: glycosyltransferase [Aliarcobacter sp.]|nr:glycosyltransferase [Aliarcobacter sp.]